MNMKSIVAVTAGIGIAVAEIGFTWWMLDGMSDLLKAKRTSPSRRSSHREHGVSLNSGVGGQTP